jgi:SpoIIAA-like
MIELLEGFPENVVAIAARRQVTKDDYLTVVVPAVERAFAGHERVRVYYELGAGFAGFDAGAMLEDAKVGMRHLRHWDRVAVVTDVAWIGHAVSLFAFLMPAAVKVFATKDGEQARAWIVSDS